MKEHFLERVKGKKAGILFDKRRDLGHLEGGKEGTSPGRQMQARGSGIHLVCREGEGKDPAPGLQRGVVLKEKGGETPYFV